MAVVYLTSLTYLYSIHSITRSCARNNVHSFSRQYKINTSSRICTSARKSARKSKDRRQIVLSDLEEWCDDCRLCKRIWFRNSSSMHSLLFLSFVLVFFIFHAYASSSTDEDILYPPLWRSAPSALTDFPLVNESTSSYRLIDPWLYPHRLGLYKILIEITTPFMPFCSLSNASNILFVLPSQFGWLFHSNRLFTNGTMNISPDSWWASANYFLAVVPFLVANDMGLIAEEPFEIVKQENFCSDSHQCHEQVPQMMEKWKHFFQRLQESKSCIGNEKISRLSIDHCYLAPMWLAYKSSIDQALPLVASKLAYLPSDAERLFGLAWVRLISLIVMSRKNTNLYETIKNQRQFLPFRMLTDSDRPPQSNDLPDSVNQSLKVLFSFRFDWLSFIEKIWERITCNYQSRIDAQYSLDMMAVSKLIAFHHLAKATVNAFLYDCDRFP